MRVKELPFKHDLMTFATYANEFMRTNDKQSLEKMLASINKNTYLKIQKIKLDKASDLLENRLLKDLLELYVTGYESDNLDQIRDAFNKFYSLQNEYPFTDNKKMYMDAGCQLHSDPLTDSLRVMYPVYFYPAHLNAQGDKNSVTIGGYFKPSRKLTKQEMVELVKECPLAFEGDELATKIIATVLRKYSRI